MTIHLEKRIDRKKRLSEKFAFGVFRALSLLVVGILFVILGFIVIKGFSSLSWSFLTEWPKDNMTAGGIYPAIIGTFYLIIGSIPVSYTHLRAHETDSY